MISYSFVLTSTNFFSPGISLPIGEQDRFPVDDGVLPAMFKSLGLLIGVNFEKLDGVPATYDYPWALMNCPLFSWTIYEVVPSGDLLISNPPGVLLNGLLDLFIRDPPLLLMIGVVPFFWFSTTSYPSWPIITYPLWFGSLDVKPLFFLSFGEIELLLSWSSVFWFGLKLRFW